MTMPTAVTCLPATTRGAAELTDEQLVRLVQSTARESQQHNEVCEQLIGRYQSLVRSSAQRYRNSPESQEELMQVGYVGLLKAINNFDPAVGSNLAAYAQPCISGEIKRHFRDKRWQVHVKRSAQELRQELRRARADLTQSLARTPRSGELTEYLGISDADLQEAERADVVFQASSLDAPLSDAPDAATLADLTGEEDPQLEHALDIQAVWTHWGDLPDRQQRLLLMRFYGNMTQAEIGERLGISQMHVSRLLAGALDYLRERLIGPDDDADPQPSGGVPARSASMVTSSRS
jgi:RNA polymerase sigma-B factor